MHNDLYFIFRIFIIEKSEKTIYDLFEEISYLEIQHSIPAYYYALVILKAPRKKWEIVHKDISRFLTNISVYCPGSKVETLPPSTSSLLWWSK